MRPIYENINVAIDTSLKIKTYKHSDKCELSNWHVHPEFEIVYVKNGSGALRVDSKIIPYTQGALIFLGPNIPHADFGNKEHEDNMEVVIQFGKDFIDKKLSVFPAFKSIRKLILSSKRVLLFKNHLKNELAFYFENLEGTQPAEKLITLLLILNKLSYTKEYQTLLGASELTDFKYNEIERLEIIFEYINENYHNAISTSEMAQLVGLTTNSFCRFFKKMTHQTFVHFLNGFKTGKAIELFNETKLSISEIMYKCGYNDPSYFTKQFKKYHGVTPSNYSRLKSSPMV